MRSRFYEYYLDVVRPMLICQFNYLKRSEVPKIEGLRVGFSFTNLTGEEDWRLLKSFKFLAGITGRRAGLGKLYWSSAGGREQRYVGTCYVTLRGDAAYNFLEYLVQVVLPLHHRRYGFLHVGVGSGGVCNFVLSDLGVFFRQTEDLIGFNGKVNITIGTSAKREEEVVSLLRGFGLSVKSE